MTPALYASWIAIVALQRLHELALSRRNLSRVPLDRRRPPPESAGGYAAMVALHVALLVLPLVEHVVLDRRPPTWMVVACVFVFAAAQVLRYWTIHTLGPSWNARGIVSPDWPVAVSGPYRWVRHPNYVAVTMEFVSLPLGGGAWISCVVLNLVHVPILVRRIRGEERELAHLPGWSEHVRPRPRFLPRSPEP